jgi:hypothetical protein
MWHLECLGFNERVCNTEGISNFPTHHTRLELWVRVSGCRVQLDASWISCDGIRHTLYPPVWKPVMIPTPAAQAVNYELPWRLQRKI